MEGNQKREVDDAGCQPVKASILCVNNCGFFGTAATKNFCSKCYRDFFLKQSKGATVKVFAGKKAVELITETENQIPEGQETNAIPCGEGTTSKDPETRPANRCSFCKKRVGLTGFKCRCEQTFCSIHRYSDKHNCLFDYKSAAQDEIAKANPVVKADKIEKI